MVKLQTLGADPEFILKDQNNPIPAYYFITGNKHFPISLGDGFEILHDNVMIEGNIPPANTKEEFIEHMRLLKVLMAGQLPENIKIYSQDSANYEDLSAREANIFGCDPFENCWTYSVHRAENMSRIKTRVAGFHIHIGYESDLEKHIMDNFIARAFDLFLTIPSYQINPDKTRLKYYGGLGNFRSKPYGIECRSLGSFMSQDRFLGPIVDKVTQMFEYLNDSNNHQILAKLEFSDIYQALSDSEERVKLYTHCKLPEIKFSSIKELVL